MASKGDRSDERPAAAARRGWRKRSRAWAPALLAGAALGVTAVELWSPGLVGRAPAALLGAAYAALVRALVRTFPVRAPFRPLAGLVVGPLPFALLAARALPRDERLGLGLALALLGALVGALEAGLRENSDEA